jgi:hypothetical protein
MAALTAANVVVTLNSEDIDRSPDGRIGIRTFPTVAFGNGVLTYPALGVPMPALGKFGFLSAIKRAYFEQPANGFIYHFDRANHKIRIFNGAGAGTIAVANHVNIAVPAPANHSHDLIIAANSQGDGDVDVGANTANNALVANAANAVTISGGNATKGGVQAAAVPAPANIANLTHTVSGAGTAGALVEMDSAVTPAAVTLNMEMVGH